MSSDPDANTPLSPDRPLSVQFDEVVHQRTRLSVLAVLSEVREADFPYLKSTLQLTDGNLGQHIEVLVRHGLVSVRKGHKGRKPRTWVRITRAGEAALAAEINALTALLGLRDNTRRTKADPTG